MQFWHVSTGRVFLYVPGRQGMEVACVVMVVRMLEASVQCCVVYIEALKGREWEMKHRDSMSERVGVGRVVSCVGQ